MTKRWLGRLCLLVLLAGALAWRLSLYGGVPHATAQTARPAVPVTPGVVTAHDMPVYLNGIGTVQAFNTVTIETRVGGPIVKVAFTEGQEVKQGDLLFQIDPRPYRAALEQAVAAKAKDQAQLVTAKADLARYASLVGRGFQTRQSYDDQRGLVAQLQAAIEGDQAQIDTAALNLGYTDIRSPIDGRTGAQLVDIGNLLQVANNTPLVIITQIKPISVSFTLPQNALDEVRRYQQRAPLSVIAFGADGRTRLGQGKLTLIDNMISQATGTIRLKARFPNRDERLWPGEFVTARLVLRVRRDVATVPSQALQQGPDGDYVYVIGRDDTVTRQIVTVADVQNGTAAITAGLKVGQQVVVEGQFGLTEGARVTLRRGHAAKSASRQTEPRRS
ncbi:MAG: efflux RND transporter periplasmic adaptor subunit [Rhodospirillales bacterium]|jgi:multidrug efflux system membrane fusion protein|nr:efflux RND transporter periplasmic adaptor subunit [Rhodospirillales bacterium]